MNLRDLLEGQGFDPQHVLALRHRPREPELRKVLPWLAADRPDVFNAYQSAQSKPVDGAIQRLVGSGYVASFIGHEPGKALFVGLYSIAGATRLGLNQFQRIPANQELESLGMDAWGAGGASSGSVLWFDLRLTDFYPDWKGKLIVNWPLPEKSWWRMVGKPQNEMRIAAILEDSAFDAKMPEWDELNLTQENLHILPKSWKDKLSEWRGIYYIFDTSDRSGYVGAAYGQNNLLGRWLNYAATGHGENKLLQRRDARNFRFTILQLVSPTLPENDILKLEGAWKRRLHTRVPHGLNIN